MSIEEKLADIENTLALIMNKLSAAPVTAKLPFDVDISGKLYNSSGDVVIDSDLDMHEHDIENVRNLSVERNILSKSIYTNSIMSNNSDPLTIPSGVVILGTGNSLTMGSGSDIVLVDRLTDNSARKILALDSSHSIVVRDANVLHNSDNSVFGTVGTVFGSEFQSNQILAASFTTSTFFVDALVLETHEVPAGTYFVSFSCLCTSNSSVHRSILQFVEDVNQLNVSTIYSSSGVLEPMINTMNFITNLSPGSHTYKLRYKSSDPTSTASISDAKIIFYRLE